MLRLVKRLGCDEVRRRGSHAIVRCPGGCQTTIPVHRGQDLPKGTVRAIERQLERCLGSRWLTGT